ncbi:putative plus-end-directed kinesin ATPase transcription factor bZIP family [Helianthus annuus]|uniref:Kinesin-like protein n=1 Tax=Helianthus annuus TaxID=4232 RepID=A0A9K3N1M8_HELAN|nr:kinesin-like protein KIN-7K, chloroplastic isoform X2 [Helianthus annuus]KAF5783711.1 putative plus-end-directed kinesin ATPase transcription factor bZIP family [Helianthus annuus]KAJ0511218.1 putative plus-end-directed kinesin ATPase transcription factor bZIP family [Helianthus annuus]KAJ0518954.1 putative plus-end-directed kinesin ATPase transcription factor bZIP family [Helianthus annuus]KAJ0876772.1 putative plus-end-directed kinesin ATPase transcription factor bZIP family [Helianthus an
MEMTQARKSTSKYANSPSSSTTSSSKQFPEASVNDNLSSPASSSIPLTVERSKENVTVTVRFRPLSPREIRRGEEIAWYADGETILRNEETPSIAYAYDRVFGPTTTTRHVYDIAAQHVVSSAMEGVNGTIFAYGVTSSGKTHTMHGDQRSPGIIPFAVKDAFSIIQETPNREFLLRVSYLEIYNEVVNDLLNPAGQNLRIREESQGAFVEGITEEVVLSPAHVLSLIAAGEEHRHVGSTNYNLLSSRSHTIFTLTIESSPCGENGGDGTVSFSQLNLVDLAGSESSKAETTSVHRKEGSYINKSLLSLGTVISKLTDGKSSHIPYRDSKLTRLLQSSLSGHGRVSLICTVTPSSSNSEETHNTLKFAHRAKYIEIQAAQNKIIDEKSLIKKYQNEIRSLKEELEHLKGGVITVPQLKHSGGDDLAKQKLEDGEVELQSRLEQEEAAKEALLSRIQRLTKLILVSNKSSHASRFSHRPLRRGHSFGEEELAYLPHKRRDSSLDEENIELYISVNGNVETNNDVLKDEKKIKKPGLLNWLKLRKRDNLSRALTSTSDKSSGVKSISPLSTPPPGNHNPPIESIHSHSAEFLLEPKLDQQTDDDNSLSHETPPSVNEQEAQLNEKAFELEGSMKTIDQIDSLREQENVLSGEVAIHLSTVKRLSDETTRDTNNEFPSSASELEAQLNEKSFELEVKTTENRVIQEQLNQKINECEGLQETIASLKQLLSDAQHKPHTENEVAKTEETDDVLLRQAQAYEIEELKQKVTELTESKDQLEAQNRKLANDSSYAKGLASAAAVELTALAEELAKLMNQNEKLTAELAAAATTKHSPTQRKTPTGPTKNGRNTRPKEQSPSQMELKRELALSREREMSYEAMISKKDKKETELQQRLDESKQREAYLENELANMWVLVAKLKRPQGEESEPSESSRESQRVDGWDLISCRSPTGL